jgi:PiT family inorganic phosphate transporter
MNALLAIATLFVSYANGANDNFKGVATLYGGKVLDYKKALIWATITTFAGSIVSFILATKLLVLFSGKGLVAASVLKNPTFLVSVALAAAGTVMLATLLRFPISTTHSLVGGLLGAGIVSGGLTSFAALGKLFFIPLLAGPVVSVLVTMLAYMVLHQVRRITGVESSYCLCVGERQEVLIGAPGLLTIRSTGIRVTVDEEKKCRMLYTGNFLGWNAQKVMDFFHFISGGAVSFARGLNDTPKIAALLLAVSFLPAKPGLLLVAFCIAIGGFIHSRGIAQRMSFEITEMNPGQAFTGNFVTALLVILASLFGFPLSTTHVSCGSLFGIGIVNGTAKKNTILQILLGWIFTLPIATVLAVFFWYLFR